MGKPAARIGDMHVCPMVTPGVPPIPHVGGPVIGPGAPTVLIGGVPAALMGDMCTCVGPPDTIMLGSTGVFITGKPAARMGDTCAHGGTITLGCPTVLIGEAGGGGGGGLGAMPVNVLNDLIGTIPPAVRNQIIQIVAMKEAAINGTQNVGATTTLEQLYQQRKDTASDFYKKSNPSMSDRDVTSHISGIDFTKPVLIVQVPPDGAGEKGDTLFQYQKQDDQGTFFPGNYYAVSTASTPSELGVSAKYSVKKKIGNQLVQTDEVKEVQSKTIQISTPVKGLKSTSKAITDTWSLKNQTVDTVGGATQIYIP